MVDDEKPDLTSAMPRVSFLEHESLIEMEFKNDSGKEQTLVFNPDRFEAFMGRACQLVAEARIRIPSTTGLLLVHAVETVDVQAEPAAGGTKVLLTLQTDKGLLCRYAMPPDKVEPLRRELYRAARSAKKQASQSRH